MAFSSCSCGRFFITYSNGTGKIFTHLYFHIYQFCRSLFILISSGKNNQLRNTGEEEKNSSSYSDFDCFAIKNFLSRIRIFKTLFFRFNSNCSVFSIYICWYYGTTSPEYFRDFWTPRSGISVAQRTARITVPSTKYKIGSRSRLESLILERLRSWSRFFGRSELPFKSRLRVHP